MSFNFSLPFLSITAHSPSATMNPFPAGYTDSEQGPEIEKIDANLAPPSFGPPGYSAVDQPPINVIQQDRPRNACRRRFRHFLACTFILLGILYVVRNKHLNPTVDLSTVPSAVWS